MAPRKTNGTTATAETPAPVVEQALNADQPTPAVISQSDIIIANGTDRLPRYLLDWDKTQKALRDPFDPEDVYFLPQGINYDEKTAVAAAYADSRVYTNRMNAVIGAGFWTSDVHKVEIAPFTKMIKEKRDWKTKEIITPASQISAHKVGVNVRVGLWLGPVLGWVFQDSTGAKDTADENWITSGEAQAYKRAMSKWGPGEYFYRFGKQSYAYDTKKGVWKEQPAIPDWAYPNHDCSDCGAYIDHFTWTDKDNVAQSKHFWDIVLNTRNRFGRQLCPTCAKKAQAAQTTPEAKERLQ